MDSRLLICLLLVIVGSCQIEQSKAQCYTAHTDMTCQSWSYRYASCRAPGPVIHVSLKVQLSRTTCRPSVNFGHHTNDVWVNHGCRAVFSVSYHQCSVCHHVTSVIQCSSWGYTYASCPAPGPVSGISVDRQLSRSACTQPYSYGYDGNNIYTNHGCRAYFRVTYNQC